MPDERLFSTGSATGKELRHWFDSLDLGQRARLRRCHRPADVILEPSFHRLAARLPEVDSVRLAPIVWTLSHLRGTDSRRLGSALKGRLSDLRFRRLLEARDRDELADDLRAAAQLLDRRANVLDIARIIYFWGDIERRRLATEYYGASE